jgi:MmyB-like transcription regulator ligand binding domain
LTTLSAPICSTSRAQPGGRDSFPHSADGHTFLDPTAQEFFLDWEKAAKDLVAALRQMAGRNPCDRALSDLIGELSTRSDAFRTWWAAHNVRYHQTGTKRLHHPGVGDVELSYEVMQIAADTDLRLAIFTAEPGSHSQQALDLLASWAATPDQLPGKHPAADDAQRP